MSEYAARLQTPSRGAAGETPTMGMERDAGVDREGELKSVKKRQCWTSPPTDTLMGFPPGCCAPQAGLSLQSD